ncbi:spore coat U domain-containing protein [Polaromonas sp.]|uniref:Csu type fimbrial protein n=1 Tax=Polaromonas sp. TaxID=1869339 RepID=UPI003569B3B2
MLARLGVLASVLCMAYVGNASAATAAGVMTVTATVTSTCTVSTSALGFGSSASTATEAGNGDVTGAVSVNCTTGSAYTVALDKEAGARLAIRKMTSGVNTLSYTVYTRAARAAVSGDGTASSTVADTGSGATQVFPAYGRIFAGQTVPAAAYPNTVNLTITY